MCGPQGESFQSFKERLTSPCQCEVCKKQKAKDRKKHLDDIAILNQNRKEQ